MEPSLEVSAADREAIAQTASEYFQAWFAADGERMRRVLHPALAKRKVRDPSTGSFALDEVPTDDLVEETNSGGGISYEHWQEVTVLDAVGDIATVKVKAQPFLAEYLHLARFGDKWLIVNSLYMWADLS